MKFVVDTVVVSVQCTFQWCAAAGNVSTPGLVIVPAPTLIVKAAVPLGVTIVGEVAPKPDAIVGAVADSQVVPFNWTRLAKDGPVARTIAPEPVTCWGLSSSKFVPSKITQEGSVVPISPVPPRAIPPIFVMVLAAMPLNATVGVVLVLAFNARKQPIVPGTSPVTDVLVTT